MAAIAEWLGLAGVIGTLAGALGGVLLTNRANERQERARQEREDGQRADERAERRREEKKAAYREYLAVLHQTYRALEAFPVVGGGPAHIGELERAERELGLVAPWPVSGAASFMTAHAFQLVHPKNAGLSDQERAKKLGALASRMIDGLMQADLDGVPLQRLEVMAQQVLEGLS